MRTVYRGLLALTVVATFACSDAPTPPPSLPAPPAILSFAADKPRLSAGEQVTLTWTTRDATAIELVDQAGQKLETSGTPASGSAVVTPAQSSFFVLRATGEGGADRAFAQVAVDEDVKDVFLVAVPPQISSGSSAQLLWSVPNAASARIESSDGQRLDLDVSNASGVLDVTPARSTTYSLVGVGTSAAEVSTSLELKVIPVVHGFSAAPAAARVSESITLQWKSAGATKVVLSEATFGELQRLEGLSNVEAIDEGSFTWTVPDTLPGGGAVRDGQPLRFTLAVSQENPEVTHLRHLDSFVGDGPRITSFEAPTAVTGGKTVHLEWRTLNASRVQVRVDGALVYEPLPGDLASVAGGSLTLPAPTGDRTVELLAYGHNKTMVSSRRAVRVVAAPVITSFELPPSVTAAGDPATATWNTQNATGVYLRIKDGPVMFSAPDLATAAAGSTPVRTGARTTFVLEAWNDAGDVATSQKTIEVGGTPAITAAPTPITPGELVTVDWSLDPATTARVLGDPTQAAVRNNPAAHFYDLDGHTDAQRLTFASDDDVQALSLGAPFRFPFVGRTAERFYVSTNGFIAFDPSAALPNNEDLTATGARLPAMLAPFWDDLSLGADGEVLYLVEGTAFPRRLVVQWNKVEAAGGGELTFQVQLLETGEFRFVYGMLTGPNSAGESATIGWRVDETLAVSHGFNLPKLLPDDELEFFGNGSLTGQLGLRPAFTGAFTLFAQLIDGSHVAYPARVNVVAPGSVIVNEAMIRGAQGLAEERWVELANVSNRPVDLSGTVLSSSATGTSFTIPEGMEIPAGGFVVFGASSDPLANGGAPVEFAWSGLSFDDQVDDTLELRALNPVSTLSWSAAKLVAGTSVVVREAAIDGSGAPFACPARTETYGSNGAFGTPGARNEPCYPYAATRIGEDLEDISGFGTPLFAWEDDDEWAVVDLSSAPFTYFGTAYSQLTVDSNGYLVMGQSQSSQYGNDLVPANADPLGALAVFWDDLELAPSVDAQVYVARLPATGILGPRWIIHWHEVSHISAGDTLNFQIKLFDTGVVEYHYGDMVSGSSSLYADGNSATVWLAAPNGSSALPIGLNQPVIHSNLAWRFTPAQ